MQKVFTPITMAGLLDHLAEGIVITDSDGAVQYINQAALDLLGLSQRPARLYDAVAPFGAWQELLEANASVHLYRESGRVDIRTRQVSWDDRPAWQLMLSGGQQTGQRTGHEPLQTDYLAAISRISKQLSLTLNLPNVLQAILQEAIDGTRAVGGEISLYEVGRDRFMPHLAQGQLTELPDELQAEMVRLREIQVVPLAANSDAPQMQLVAPILYEGVGAGLLRLQHAGAAVFSKQAQMFVSTLAHHAAVAMGNARRFEELNNRNRQLHRRAQQIERFVESGRVLNTEVNLDRVFEDLVYAIQEGVGFRIVALNLIDQADPAMTLRTVTAAGLPLDRLEELKQITQPWETIQAILLPEFAMASAYFIPSEKSNVYGELRTYQVSDLYRPAVHDPAELIYRIFCVDQDGVVNVYDGPGPGYEHIATLTNGTTGIYISGPGENGPDGFWVPIIHRQARGWVNERYLQKDTEPAALWDAEDLFFIPLYDSTGEPIGLISLDSPIDGRRPDINVAKVLEIFANQASAAVENARLMSETLARSRELHILFEASNTISSTLDQDRILSATGEHILRAIDAKSFTAYQWNRLKDKVTVLYSADLDPDFAVLPAGTTYDLDGQSAFHDVLTDGKPSTHRVANGEPWVPKNPAWLVEATSFNVAWLPIIIRDDVFGLVEVATPAERREFGDTELQLMAAIMNQATTALENAQLFADLRELNEQLDIRVSERTHALGQERDRGQYLLRITTELSASLDQDRVLNLALELVNEVVHATQGSILLIDYEHTRLIYRAAFGTSLRLPPDGFELALRPDEGLAGLIIQNRKAVIIHDTKGDERWIMRPDSPDHRSVMGVPLISGEEVIGLLMLFHSEPGAFSQEQLELVEVAAIQVANAISNAQLYLLIHEQAERLGKMLREEQIEAAKNQAILESIADGVLVADGSGRVILANLPASLILDIPREQLLGKSVKELLGLYGSSTQSLARTFDLWSRQADTQQRALLANRLAIEDKFVSVHLSPVYAGGHFLGTVSIFRDVTQDVAVDRMKSEFVSTVSHELRTPMTSVKGYADLLLMGAAGPMTDEQTRYLVVIKNNADRLSMLVNDLLDISRIETGKTELDLRPVHIPQLVEQAIEGHFYGRIEHNEKSIAIKSELAPTLPLVQADFARVTQILTNLLENAFHYTPDGGTITVSARANSQYVYISVSDTGIGIPREIQPKIFDRFFRAEDSEVQKVAGTGLGLAIVRSLVEMHGGKIEVFSIPGQGSTFTFSLPIVSEENNMD